MGNKTSTQSKATQPGTSGSTVSTSPCPAVQQNNAATSSSCPVPQQYRSQPIYNVYGQRIDIGSTASPLDFLRQGQQLDPTNQMPTEPNQLPFPGQRKILSTNRQQSTIPKGGTDSTWLYPSPQMFYNALKRKGKGDDVTEEVVDAVVYNHNVMNETTWQKVQQWESLHRNECACPKLLRFQGKPDKRSPRAMLREWFGDDTWFDRHDWWVDRCGEEVRYVIDFYFDESKAGQLEAFEVEARPALDSPGAFVDRTKMWIYTTFAKYGLPCPVTGHPNTASADADGQNQPAS